uniref:Leucine-rich repeat-containing protein 51 n=1 Tax=Percolomonas cosmopolitus TaxID=63605 RepID=A0A7S1PKS9_9EUKA|mmetsp:Transcript_9783/g.36502  ORF Transcript_9783/g.36502 Transcript_9783/m.36502 type:complete len:903 (+) Transcript_9783:206-2914(+)|eukprot:CAMPEP_0117438856 /NCGR_PEP_ID=MMETSP0759-20121206/2270_1 /TAXON_ID=63605 /ORGANISM="Percolomonas cosmopolitus, Strain WS" /LENGTH=902 /DNA_ID=CAMNT_0005230563 /DNA_START=190 /DNA_END=2898 /DNA_ORIENTATION=+
MKSTQKTSHRRQVLSNLDGDGTQPKTFPPSPLTRTNVHAKTESSESSSSLPRKNEPTIASKKNFSAVTPSRLSESRNCTNQRIKIPQKKLSNFTEELSTVSHVSTLLPMDLATNLTQLNLSFMNLKAVPTDLAFFCNLVKLNLNDNRLAEIQPWLFVKYLPQLQFVDLSNNRIPNLYDVLLLGHLPELRFLNLLGNPIGNIGNRPALIQELLFREWRPLEEEDGYFNSEDEEEEEPSPRTERLDSPLTPGTPQLRMGSKILHPPNSSGTMKSSNTNSGRGSPFTPKIGGTYGHRSPGSRAQGPSQRNTPNSLTRKARVIAGDVASVDSNEAETSRSVKRPRSARQYRASEDALSKRYGYVPSPKGTPRIKKVLEERPKSAYMKRTSAFLNREKKSRSTNYGDSIPSTLSNSKYSLKNLQSMKKAKIIIDRTELDDHEEEASFTKESTRDETKERGSPIGYQAYEEKEDRMKQFLERFRPSDMRAFKDSLGHLLDSFKSTSEIIHRLKDIPVPRKANTPFPYLVTLNGRNISVEEYLIAENEEVFDICQMSPKKVRREKPPSDWIQELDLDDAPFEEEPTGYVTSKQDFQKSEQLTDTLNYIRVNHHRADIADVSTYSDARFQVRDHKDMLKILDKSCKAEFVEMEDYKSIESTKKWSKTFSNFSADLGSINFNDVLRWEHKQIKKRADILIGKKKKKSKSHHVTKHRFENLNFQQVETTMRKMELNVNIASSKRNVKPVQPHNPHQVTEFCRQERIQRKKLAKKKGRQHEFSQRQISSVVQKNHPDDDIVQFFSTSTKQFARESNVNVTTDSDSEDEAAQDERNNAARDASAPETGDTDGNSVLSGSMDRNSGPFLRRNTSMREASSASKSKQKEEKKRELVETNEKISIGGQEFSFADFML